MEEITLGSLKIKDIFSFGGVSFCVEGEPNDYSEDREVPCKIHGTDCWVYITAASLVDPIIKNY